MAYDKVVDSAALETGLEKVANAIRTKGGTSGKLAFPDGMAEAVAAIQAGGGAEEPYIEYTYTTVGGQQYAQTAKMHGYTVVPAYAFRQQSRLQNVDLPEGITSIGTSAFYSCSALALTSLPEGLTSIGAYAFQNCSALALTSLPEGITSIGTSAFYSCSALALTSLPEGITSIGASAFYRNTGLKEITFKGTPKTIYQNAFASCTNLQTINVPWAEGAVANAPWGATNATINFNYVEAG